MATVDTARYEVVLATDLADPGLVISLPQHKRQAEAATRRDDLIRRQNAGEFVTAEVTGKTFLVRTVGSAPATTIRKIVA